MARPGPAVARGSTWRLSGALLLAGVLLVAAGRADAAVVTPRVVPQPSIVLILTDDQRTDELAEMPVVQQELVGRA